MNNIFGRWRERRKMRNTRKQLYSLSEHILSDIGLTRSDISQIGRDDFAPRRGR